MTQSQKCPSAVVSTRIRQVRTPVFGAFVGLGIFAGTLIAGQARADLAPAFQPKLTVDPEYATGVTAATDIAFAADGRALITMKNGDVSLRTLDGLKTTISGKFGTVDTESEKGLLGLVADPNAADTFYFYVSNGSTDGDKHHVYKGTLSAAGELTVDLASPIVGGSVQGGPGLEGPANHDGGSLAIYNGQLYIGVGDTGANPAANQPPQNKYSSCLNKPNGKILRVNLDGSIPTDNPLVNETSVTSCSSPTGAFGTVATPDKRIFAWGLRNPWRFWVDPHTGLMWIGDVGEGTREEISVGRGNQHYGYPFIEGTYDWTQNGQAFGATKCDTMMPGRPCTGPIYDYPHAGNTPKGAASVTGGLIPEGCGWSKVFDGNANYLFADYSAGWVRALQVNANRDGVTNAATPTNFGTFANGPVSFRMGPEASLYVVFVDVGAVYKFTPKDKTGPDCGTPAPGSGGAGGVLGGSGGNSSAPTGGASTSVGGAGNPSSGGAKAATGGAKASTGGANSSASGGASSAAGGGAPKGEGGNVNKSGCGCRVGGPSTKGFAVLGALLTLGFALGLRRKVR